MSCPTRCYCRKPACRLGRPLCRRTDNPRNITCNCGSYCLANPKGAERMNQLAWGP